MSEGAWKRAGRGATVLGLHMELGDRSRQPLGLSLLRSALDHGNPSMVRLLRDHVTADALFDLASNPLSGSLSVQVPSLDEWRSVVDKTVHADATGKALGRRNWWDRHTLPDDRMSPWGRLGDGGAVCEASEEDVLAGGRGSPWPIAQCG